MGEGTHRLTTPVTIGGEREEPRGRARELESEIEFIRRSLDRTLAELDKRRHEVTDWRLLVRRHPGLVLGVGVGVAVVVGGIIAVALLSRREGPQTRARRIGRALRRGYEHPDKVARPEPSVAVKVLAAIATTVGTALAKKYVEKLWSAPHQERY
jgi:hypothetical protein